MRRKWVVLLQVYTEVQAEGRDEAKEIATRLINGGVGLDDSDGKITDVDAIDSYVLAAKGPVQAAAEGRG
jgi:hypothetical protein